MRDESHAKAARSTGGLNGYGSAGTWPRPVRGAFARSARTNHARWKHRATARHEQELEELWPEQDIHGGAAARASNRSPQDDSLAEAALQHEALVLNVSFPRRAAPPSNGSPHPVESASTSRTFLGVREVCRLRRRKGRSRRKVTRVSTVAFNVGLIRASGAVQFLTGTGPSLRSVKIILRVYARLGRLAQSSGRRGRQAKGGGCAVIVSQQVVDGG